MPRWIFIRAATIPTLGLLANMQRRYSARSSVLTTEFKRGIEKSDGEFTHVVGRDHDLRVLSACRKF